MEDLQLDTMPERYQSVYSKMSASAKANDEKEPRLQSEASYVSSEELLSNDSMDVPQ